MYSQFNVKGVLSLALTLFVFNYSFAQFEENKGQVQDYEGQTASFVNFTFTSGQNNIYLFEKGLAYQLKRVHYPEGFKVADKFTKGKELQDYEAAIANIKIETFRVDLELVGANEDVEVVSSGRSHDYSNYYNYDVLDVHSFSKICYKNIYDGIDWVILEKDGNLKYEFIVHPGADPSNIRLRYHHQNKLKIDSEGKLVLETLLGEIVDEAPISFQGNQDVKSSYALDNGEVFFSLSDYDLTKDLVIDPLSRLWGTYYGGTGTDAGNECNTDASNNSYLAGTTTSSSAIASGGHDVTFGLNNDAFLVKFNTAGVRQWATYYGNNGENYGNSCVADGSGNVYLAGSTSSSSFMTSGGHQNSYGGSSSDAFLVKFNAAGVRQWGTMYGGSNQDWGNAVDVDPSNNVYLAGSTRSTNNIYASPGFQSTAQGGVDAFLVKFNTSGVRQWGTYHGTDVDDGGGGEWTEGWDCAVSSTGYVYMVGLVNYNLNGEDAAYVVRFAWAGNAARSYNFEHGLNTNPVALGGVADGTGNSTRAYGVAVDGTGNVYMGGETDFGANGLSLVSTSYVHQNSDGGGVDGFLVKLNFALTPQWKTLYGGSGFDGVNACARQGSNIYIGGRTVSTTNIASGGFQNTKSTGNDGFLANFNLSGVRQWGTYYGGNGSDQGNGCTGDGTGAAYLAGTTASTNNMASGGHDNSKSTGNDAFLVRFSLCTSGTSTTSTAAICESAPKPLTSSSSGGSWSVISGGGTISGTTYTPANIAVSTSVTVQYTDGCGNTSTTTFTVHPTPTANAGPNQTTTCSDPTQVLSGSGGTNYSWSPSTGLSNPNIANPTANPSTNQTYTLTVTNANGCAATDVVTVTVDKTDPTANAGSNQTTTCTNPTQVLNGSGGGSYSWFPATGLSNASIPNPTANPASTQAYILTVTGANGCTDTDDVTITVNETPPTANAGANQTTTCTNPTQVLSGSGGGSYSWSPATGLSNANIANPTANPASTQTYTLTVTAANGCTDTDVVTVTVDKTDPTANAGSNQTTTCTNPTQVLNGSGGGSYSWFPATGLSNASIPNPTANPASTQAYILTVTGANGCTDTDDVTITVNETPPTANAGSNQTTTCTNPTQVLSGSGGGTYSWSPATGLSNANIAAPTADPSNTQTYTLTVTAANGCTDTDVVTLTVDEAPPTANAGANQTTTCTNPTQVLSGSGGGSYSWSPATGLSNASIASPTANPANTQTYTLTVTAVNGCTDTDVVTVTVDETAPTANAGANQMTTCTNPTQVLSGSGGGTYSWSPATGLSNANIAAPTADPASTQTYTLTVTAANGCTDTDVVTVTVDETAPTANAGANQTTTCTNPTQVLNGSGGGSYNWSPVTGLSDASTASPTADPASTQTYTLTVTAANGCTDTDVVTVTVDETAPAANAGANQTTTCTNPTQVLSGSGGGTYSWSPATGLSNANIAAPTADPASTQTYTLTVTAANGCTDTDAVTVTVDETAPTADAGANQITTCTNPTQVLSGSGGGTYSWSPATGLSNANIAAPTADPASTQTYTLTVTAANGCTDTDVVTVTVDETSSTVNAGPDVTTSCSSPAQTLSGSGSGTYSWSPGTGLSDPNIANPIVNPTSTTVYTLTVTGTNGCTATDDVLVTVNDTPPTVNAGLDVVTTCTNPTQVLSGSGSGTYSWSPATGLSNPNIANPTADPASTQTYTLTVTGANGCTAIDAVTVTVNETAPTADAGSNQITTCTNPTQVLSGSGGGTYGWSPATGLSDPNIATPTADPTSTQTYTLTVTGTNGCTDTDVVTVTVDETAPTVDAGTDQAISCGSTSVNLSASGTGTFLWSPATGLSDPNISNPVASSTSATTYTVTLTGANGCTATDDVLVDVVLGPTTSAAGPNQTICVAAGSVTLAGNSPIVGAGIWTQVSGPTSNISAPTSPISTVTGMTTAGTYVYEWTISNAPCPSSSDQVTIQVDLDADASFSFANATYCQSSESDTAIVTGTTGGTFATTPVGLSIDPATGIIDFATSTSGTYDVSYIVSGVCGASSTETITIEATPGPPNVTTTSGLTDMCEGEQLELVGSGSGAGATYNVYDAATNGTLLGATPLMVSPTSSITYYVEAVGSNGCSNLGGLSPFAITVNAAPTVDAGPNQSVCPGASTSLTATGATDFVWSTSEITATITVSPSVTTYYSVTGTGANGCTAEDSVLVSIIDPGILTAVDDQYDVTTEVATVLDVDANDIFNTGVVTVLTTPLNGQALANGDGTITYVSYLGYNGPDSFQYTICDVNCSAYCDTATVEINVIENIDVQVSGGFSPNDDGINETFNILGLENFPDNTLSVYNRWGNLVYQASPYENDWDGTSNVNGLVIGQRLTTGTYLYVLDLDEQTDPMTGTLELKRD